MLRLSRPLGLCLIAVLLGALLGLSLPSVTLWQRVLQDAAHGPIFAAIAVVLLAMRRVSSPTGAHATRDHAHAWLLAVGLGVATELAQFHLPDRDPSWLDLARDAAGAAFGLAVAWLVEQRSTSNADVARSSRPWVSSLAWPIALATLLGLTWRPFECARAYALRAAAFPVLAPLGATADVEFAEAPSAVLSREALPTDWLRPGDEGLAFRIDFAPGADRPAFELSEGTPDWRGYSVLALDLTNPEPHPLRMSLRVLDERHDWTYHDRFNLPVLVPERSRITVRVSLAAVATAPAHRRMDMASIADVLLFVRGNPQTHTFYVSRVWLE